jgi:hypothetical protein
LPLTISASGNPTTFQAHGLEQLRLRRGNLSYEAGPSAGLEQVRAGGNVLRLIQHEGDVLDDCGNVPATYIAFCVLDNGMLAVLHYHRDAPPPEPKGSNALEVIAYNACSVMLFTH